MSAVEWYKELKHRIETQGDQAKLSSSEVENVLKVIQKLKIDGNMGSDYTNLIEILRIYTNLSQQQQAQQAQQAQISQQAQQAQIQTNSNLFNTNQLNLLKCQIMCFKYISRKKVNYLC